MAASVKAQNRSMTTVYSNYWRVRVGKGAAVNNHMQLIVRVDRKAKKGTGGHQSAAEVSAEVTAVKAMVYRYYDFDGLLEPGSGFDLDIEIVEFVSRGTFVVAEL